MYHNHDYYLIGVLHGSQNWPCHDAINDTPGLFANLEYHGNRVFVEDWMHMGDKIKEWYQIDRTANYLSQLQPNPPFQSLWSLYDEDLFNQQRVRPHLYICTSKHIILFRKFLFYFSLDGLQIGGLYPLVNPMKLGGTICVLVI